MGGFDITDFVRDILSCDVSEVHVVAFHFSCLPFLLASVGGVSLSHISRSSGELISQQTAFDVCLVALVLAVGAPLAAFHPAFLAGADFLVDALVAADEGDFAGGEDVVVESLVSCCSSMVGAIGFPLSLSLCGHTQCITDILVMR